MAGNKFFFTLTTARGVLRGPSRTKTGDSSSPTGVECHAFNYQIEKQYDLGSGLTTGRRQHNPITIIREVDSATPLLFQALVTNESFVTAKLSFVRPDSSGKLVVHETIELTQGAIVSCKTYHGVEELTLTYEGLKVNGLPDGVIPRSLLGYTRR